MALRQGQDERLLRGLFTGRKHALLLPVSGVAWRSCPRWSFRRDFYGVDAT